MTDVKVSTPAAERQLLYRKRRRHGLRCIQIEVRQSEIESLIQRGLLMHDEAADCYAIRDALHKHLDQTLTSQRPALWPR